MSTDRIMPARDLAAELGVSEVQLHAIAHERQLPIFYSPTYGFAVMRVDLDAWRAALYSDEVSQNA